MSSEREGSERLMHHESDRLSTVSPLDRTKIYLGSYQNQDGSMKSYEGEDPVEIVETASRSSENQPQPLYEDSRTTSIRARRMSTRASVHSDVGHVLLRQDTKDKKIMQEKKQEFLRLVEKEDDVPSVWRKYYEMIYPAFFLSHWRKPESLKIVLRSWLVAWVSVVLMIIPESHAWFGNASFLLLIVAFVLPPGGKSISDVFIHSILIFTGLIYAWLHAFIAQAVSMHIRKTKFDSTSDFVQHLIESSICKMDSLIEIQRCLQREVFKGNYLEVGASFVSAFAMALALLSTFMVMLFFPLYRAIGILTTIFSVIITSYTNAFPMLGGAVQVGELIFKPVGVAAALSMISSILIFPSTALSKILDLTLKKLESYKEYSQMQIKYLSESLPSHVQFGDLSKLQAIMAKSRAMSFPIMLNARFLHKEFSYMRLAPEDVDKWYNSVVEIGNALAGLEYFYMNIQECKKWILHQTDGFDDIAEFELKNYEPYRTGVYSPVAHYEMHKKLQGYKKYFDTAENEKGSQIIKTIDDLDYIMKVIHTLFLDQLDRCHKTLCVCATWMRLTNKFRLSRFIPSCKRKYRNNMARCQEDLARVRKEMMENLDPSTARWKEICFNDEKAYLVMPVFGQASLFSFILKQYALSIEDLCSLIEGWDTDKVNPRLYIPFQKYIFRGRKNECDDPRQNERINNAIKQSRIKATKRSPDALPPETRLGVCIRRFAKGYQHLMNDSSFLLGVKMTVATVCANILAYSPATLYWYYGHRILWGPILIAISVTTDSYDSVYNGVNRIVCTFLGAFVAAISWYISCGDGRGNYYGFGAVCFVLFFFTCFHRHFSSHYSPLPAVLFSVTLVLVIGTSWQDAKMPPVASLRWGLEPAYSRFIAVLAGTSVAFVISCFPHVTTGSKKVRNLISSVLKEIGQTHCEVKEAFSCRFPKDPRGLKKLREDPAYQQIFRSLFKLAGVNKVIKGMQYEPHIMGKWPKKKYQILLQSEIHILKLYYLLLASLRMLDDSDGWSYHIRHRLGWENSDLNSAFFAVIFMSASALSQRSALPNITPSELAFKHLALLSDMGLGDPFYGSDDIFYNKVRQNSQDEYFVELNEDVLLGNDGRCNMVTLILMHLIYEKVDEIMIIVKSLVGEEFDFLTDFEEYTPNKEHI